MIYLEMAAKAKRLHRADMTIIRIRKDLTDELIEKHKLLELEEAVRNESRLLTVKAVKAFMASVSVSFLEEDIPDLIRFIKHKLP